MAADTPSPSARDAGLSADLLYRFLLGEVALQRGEPPVAARAYFEAARESRDPRARPARDRDRAGRPPARPSPSSRPRCGPSSIPRPRARSRSLRRSPAASPGKDLAEPGVDDEIRGRAREAAERRRGLGPAASARCSCRSTGSSRSNPDKADLRARARARQAVSGQSGGAFRCRATPRYTAEIPRQRRRRPGAVGSRRRARAEARLGARGAAQGRYPRAASPATRPSPTCRSSSPPIPDARAAAGALAQIYVEQKRYADARAVFQTLWDGDASRAGFRVRRRGHLDADEGLGHGRSAVPGPQGGRLRRERRRRVLPGAGRRGDGPLPGSDRALSRGARRRARAGSPSFASRR